MEGKLAESCIFFFVLFLVAKLPHSPEVILGTIVANLFRYHKSVCQHVHQSCFFIYMILDGWIIWTHNVIFITVLFIHPSHFQHIIAYVSSGYIYLRLAGSHDPVYSEYLANHCDAVVNIGIWVKYTYGEVQTHLIKYSRQFHFIIFSGYIRLVTPNNSGVHWHWRNHMIVWVPYKVSLRTHFVD